MTELVSRRSRSATLWCAAALIGVFLLTGCTDEKITTPAPSASASVAPDPALASIFPPDYTPASAETETVRIADEIVSLLPAATVLNVDSKSQIVAATDKTPAYFGELRIISLNPTIDPVAITKTLVQKIAASGWEIRGASDDVTGVHLATLTSNAKPNISWLLQLSGDPRITGQSVIQLQLASPDLPSR